MLGRFEKIFIKILYSHKLISSRSFSMNNNDLRAIFARNLRSLIEKRGESIYRVSKETNISHSYIYELCNPDCKKNPSMEIVYKLAKHFNVPPENLFKK